MDGIYQNVRLLIILLTGVVHSIMSVLGDDEQDKEAEDNYSDPDGYICSHLIQSHLDAAEAGVHATAVGDQDHVTDRGVVQEGRVAAPETGGAWGLVGEAGAPVHEAGL